MRAAACIVLVIGASLSAWRVAGWAGEELGTPNPEPGPGRWIAGPLDPDSREIRLLVAGGGCQREVDKVEVVEDETSIVIAVFFPPVSLDSDHACPAIWIPVYTSALLREPIGERSVTGPFMCPCHDLSRYREPPRGGS